MFVRTPIWRRAATIVLIVAAQASVLALTYHQVIDNHTLLTGNSLPGTDGVPPPYGYPGPVPSFNEIDPGASAWQWVTQVRKAHDLVARGELPLWNANVMLGAPLAGDPINGLMNPYTWPLIAHPSAGAWDIWLLSRLLMAGVLCTLLGWYLGLRPLPATIAGLVYMMSGVFQVRTTTIQTSDMALLPLLILAVELCVRRPTRWSSGLLGLAVPLTVLFGMPEETFLCLLMAAIYFAVRVGAEWVHRRRPPTINVAYAAVGGGFVGLLLSLPLVFPFVEFVRSGLQFHGSNSHAALVIQDARQLLSVVGPHWNIVGPRLFTSSTFAPVDNWFGIGALFLAVLGAFSRGLPRGVRALFVIAPIAVEAKNVGFPDWFNQMIGHTPVLGQVTFWAYSGVLVSLGVAILAGAGLQRIELRRVRRTRVVAAASVLAAGVAIAAPVFLAGTSARASQVAITVVVFLVVVAGAIVAVSRGSRWHTYGVLVCATAVTAELILLAMPENPLSLRYDPLSPTPTTTYLQRVMPSGSGRSYSFDGTLYPTTSAAFGLDDIRDLDAIYPGRTYQYLKLFVDPDLSDRFDGLGNAAALVNHNPFFDLLNVEYVLVAPPLPLKAAGLAGGQFVLQAIAGDGVGIYRNEHAAPRAQVFFNVTGARSESAAAAVMAQPGFDPSKRAVVEAGQTLPPASRDPIPARVVSYSDSKVTITTSTSQPGMLVLADAYYPGWEAEVDGHPVTIHPADIALRGIEVPAGRHTVIVEYRPLSFAVGALGVPIGLIAFGVGGWAVPDARRSLRRRSKRAA